MVHPPPNGLVGNHNAPFRQQIFYVAEAEGEAEIEPDGLMDDLGWEAIPTVADFSHPEEMMTRPKDRKPSWM